MPHRCILQAEDEPADVFLLRHAVVAAGIDLCLHDVHDGQAVIDYLAGAGVFADRLQHHFPSMILLDLKMPRKSGFQVLEWLRDNPGIAPVPVLLFSSSMREQDVIRGYQLGANAFIVKPASVEDRLRFVRNLVEFWFQTATLPELPIH